MKKYLMLLLSLVFISVSCEKPTTGLIDGVNLTGTWLLKQYAGGMVYRLIIPTDSTTITFDKSGKYTSGVNYGVTARGNFRIANAPNDNYYSQTVINLIPDDGDKIIYGITLKRDSLILSDGCCDRFFYTYVKVK